MTEAARFYGTPDQTDRTPQDATGHGTAQAATKATPGARLDAADLAADAQRAAGKPVIEGLLKRLFALQPRLAADSVQAAMCATSIGSLGAMAVDSGPDFISEDHARALGYTRELDSIERSLQPDALSRFVAACAVDGIEARS